MVTKHNDPSFRGALMALFAFFMWGILPVFWKSLQQVSALEIFCHRVTWSFAFILLFLLCSGNFQKVIAIGKDKKNLFFLIVSSLMLSGNWLLYIWAIVSGRVVESSLGYYLNPLMNIFVGICLFHERSSKPIWIAISLATISVLYQILALGSVPWLGLGISVTFCLYAIVRKITVVESLPGLFVETAVITPFALGYLVWLAIQGNGAWGTVDLRTDILLISSGIVTTLPLVGFTFGARRINLTTLGILQYISPTLMFFLGTFVYGEPMTKTQVIMFFCIWTALFVYTYDSFRYHKKIMEKEDS